MAKEYDAANIAMAGLAPSTISFMAHFSEGGTTVPSSCPGTSTFQKPESMYAR